EDLRTSVVVVHHEEFTHPYPCCWRCKQPVIFRATEQWFILIDHDGARQKAQEAVKKTRWVPAWGETRISSMLEGRPDWCVSRQRTWGVPIPAFYDAQGNAVLNVDIIRSAAALVEQHGSNVWFEKSAAELWSLLKPNNW